MNMPVSRPLKNMLESAAGAALAGMVLAVAGLLTACAVGPNFKAPEAPHGAGFVPTGQSPAPTRAAEGPGGQAQRFV